MSVQEHFSYSSESLHMCILFLAIKQHPEYPMLICANRDEFHDRSTQSAHFWSEYPELLAGKDLEEGGSWFGINKDRKFAAITNIRSGNKLSEDKKSRGKLVTMSLLTNNNINQQWLEEHCDEYNPFNLIYGTLENLYYFNSITQEHTLLKEGFHAISNGSMDDIWPKMAKGERQLEAVVKSAVAINPANLLAILRDQSRPTNQQLPSTGISVQMEQLLSSIFICSTNYGTRSSSLILQKSDNSVEFIEAAYDRFGSEVNMNSFSL